MGMKDGGERGNSMKSHFPYRRRLGVFLLVLASLSIRPLSAELIAKVPQVMDPFFMTIAEGRMFVVENSSNAHIFKLGDGGAAFLKTIGREGQGPGEFDFMYAIRFREGKLDATASHKIVCYTPDGEYLDEFKVPVPFFKGGIDRVGKGFLVGDYDYNQPKPVKTIRLYDSSFKLIKEVGAWEQPLLLGKINPAADYQTFRVAGDRIFIVETARDTKVTVLDPGGNAIKEFLLPLESLKMTAALKAAITKALKDGWGTDPGWNMVEERLAFSDYAPGLDWIDVADGMLIARTYRYKGDEVEFVFFDLDGKEIKRMFLPFTGRNSDGIPYCVHQGRFYYLKINEADETYELHAIQVR